jgi:hypothetical protein
VIAAIDFGASTTKVAVAETGDAGPRMLAFGANLDFPTAIYIGRDGNVLVGDDAINIAGQDYSRLTPNLKQQVNSGLSADLRSHPVLAGHSVTLVTAVSRVLAHAFDAVRVAAGDDTKVDTVILTHPVAWGERELVLLISAARAAGISCPIRLLCEPLAVAGLRRLRPEAPGPVAVFDLGASTFDAAVLDRSSRDLLEPQYVGQRLFGGDDVDEALRQVILDSLDDPSREDFAAAYLNRRFDVDKAVRAAKVRLSEREKTRFLFGERGRGADLTRAALEGKVEREVKRCADALRVGLAELSGAHRLAALILSGGSSRMPLVGQLADELAREFGVAGAARVPEDISPGHAVALGAVDAALSGVYGPLAKPAVRSAGQGAIGSSGKITREATWSEADSDHTDWLAAFAQYPTGTIRRRIIFLNEKGDFVAAATEGSRIAVWRGWGSRDVRELSSNLELSTVWNQYQTVNGVPSLRPDQQNRCLMLAPVRQRRAVVAQGQNDDPQCGWLDGRPVALIHRADWSAIVEIADSYNDYRRRFPRPAAPAARGRYPFGAL